MNSNSNTCITLSHFGINEGLESKTLYKKTDKNGYIVHYNKDELKLVDSEYVQLYSKCRSLIFNKDDQLIGFAPVKSQNNTSIDKNFVLSDINNLEIEEFVEGTMITLFYDKTGDLGSEDLKNWCIATKTKIGGTNSFYNYGIASTKSFKEMFKETIQDINLNLDSLDKDVCYSFVMQHMENRVVSSYQFNDLVLVEAYKINMSSCQELYHIDFLDVFTLKESFADSKVRFPERFDKSNYISEEKTLSFEKIKERFNSKMDVDNINLDIFTFVDTVPKGIIVKNKKTGQRFKYRNETYEFLAKLRGNQSKLEYHYLTLRKNNNMELFLRVFPEFEKQFLGFRDKVHNFTQALHYNYFKCFKEHSSKLNEISFELRSHLYEIHKNYLENMRGTGKTVQFNDIKNYVNELPEARLMFSINYNTRPNEKRLSLKIPPNTNTNNGPNAPRSVENSTFTFSSEIPKYIASNVNDSELLLYA